MLLIESPKRLFPDVDPIKRRLCEKDSALADELGQMTVEKSEQQRRDVIPVGVSVSQNDDLAVAKLRDIEVSSRSRSPRR